MTDIILSNTFDSSPVLHAVRLILGKHRVTRLDFKGLKVTPVPFNYNIYVPGQPLEELFLGFAEVLRLVTCSAHLACLDDILQAPQLLLERHVVRALLVDVVRGCAEEGHVPVWPMHLYTALYGQHSEVFEYLAVAGNTVFSSPSLGNPPR